MCGSLIKFSGYALVIVIYFGNMLGAVQKYNQMLVYWSMAMDHLLNLIMIRDRPIMLFLPIMLCCSAQNFAHVKDLCLKSDCSIRVYSLVIIKFCTLHSSTNNNYGECSIRVYSLVIIKFCTLQ